MSRRASLRRASLRRASLRRASLRRPSLRRPSSVVRRQATTSGVRGPANQIFVSP
ncbi:pentapeptide repeat-containing protein [Pedococcus sp. P5_B7]